MRLLQNAVFLTSVAQLRDLPRDAVAEVAFAGRSNAGKSSAINTLAARTRLAYVSKTPGRTQLLNYFTLAPGKFLVDLPGYGYAKAPDSVRDQWEGLLGPYLQGRSPLTGIVLIMDCRHPLTPLDHRMLGWFAPTGRPIHILLSKADKLSRQQSLETLRQVKKALLAFGDNCTVQLFSSLKKTGIEEAEAAIAKMLGITWPPEKTTAGSNAGGNTGEKKPPVSVKRGVKGPDVIKAPAQGGEAGDGANHPRAQN